MQEQPETLFVERPEHETEIARLLNRDALADSDLPQTLFFKGDGGAGKSELLNYARNAIARRLGDRTPVAVIGASFEVGPEDSLTAVWATALDSMKDQLVREAARLGLAAPEFSLFDAFYGRGISTSSAAEQWERNRPLWAKIALGIGLLVAVMAALDPLLPLDSISLGLAGLVDGVAPGWGTPAATLFVVLFVGIGLAGLFGKQLTGGAVALDERVGKRELYQKFGASPLQYHEKLSDDGPSSLPQVDEHVLLRAFNADLADWLGSIGQETTVLVTLDLQHLAAHRPVGGEKSFRELLREGIETMLAQDIPAAPGVGIDPLRQRQRFLIASRYERFWNPRSKPSGAFHRVKSEAHKIGVLDRQRAWALLGKLLTRATASDTPTALAAELKRVYDQAGTTSQPWNYGKFRAPADGGGGDFHLHLLLVATAFGVLSAIALRSGSRTAEFDQRLASSVMEREQLLHERLGDRDPQAWATDPTFDGRFEALLRDTLVPVTRGEDHGEPLIRALGRTGEDEAVAACMLGVFDFGMSKAGFTLAALDASFDDLRRSDNFRFDDATGRLQLKPDARNIAVEAAPNYAKARDGIARIAGILAEEPTELSLGDAAHIERALIWAHSTAFLLQHGPTPQLKNEKFVTRLQLVSEALITGAPDRDIDSEDFELLGHKLAEIAFLGLTMEQPDPHDSLSGRLHDTLDRIRESYTQAHPVSVMPVPVRQAYLGLIRQEANDPERAERVAAELHPVSADDETGHWLDIAAATGKADYTPELFERLLERGAGQLDDNQRTRLFRLVRKIGNSLAAREPDIARSQQVLDATLDRLAAFAQEYPDHAMDIAFLTLRTTIFRKQRLLRDAVTEGPEWASTDARLERTFAKLSEQSQSFLAPLELPEWNDLGDLLSASAEAKGAHAAQIDEWLRARRVSYFDDAIASYENACAMDGDRCHRFAALSGPLALSLRLLFEHDSKIWNVHESEVAAIRDRVRAVRQVYLDFVLDKFESKTLTHVPDRQNPDFVAACRAFTHADFPSRRNETERFDWTGAAREIATALLNVLAFANPQNAQVHAGRPVVVDSFARAQGRPVDNDARGRGRKPEGVVVVAKSGRCEVQPVIAQGYVPSPLWGKWYPRDGETLFAELDGHPFITNLLAEENPGLVPPRLKFPYWPATAKGAVYCRRMLELFFPVYPEDILPDDKPWLTMGGSNSILVFETDRETRTFFGACGGALEKVLRAIANLNRIVMIEWQGPPEEGEPIDVRVGKARDFIAATYGTKAGDGRWIPNFLPVWNDDQGRLDLWTATGDPAAPLRDPQKLRTFHGLFTKVFNGEPHYDFGFVEAMADEAKRRAN